MERPFSVSSIFLLVGPFEHQMELLLLDTRLCVLLSSMHLVS
jgi:hypothetical protein